ncbi:hypothetical protein EVAR_60823_1 [Eumeta japonica]|uniref:Uncharacterized protein n=1 Tax=Eumeta variegata TaxID=151549 RepID=A0A4C1ZYK6_EUMVA|nr:hypothetical protein EVAR_60823_1 [Eumeta japonica]
MVRVQKVYAGRRLKLSWCSPELEDLKRNAQRKGISGIQLSVGVRTRRRRLPVRRNLKRYQGDREEQRGCAAAKYMQSNESAALFADTLFHNDRVETDDPYRTSVRGDFPFGDTGEAVAGFMGG